MANELHISYPVASSTVYAIIRRQSDAYVWNGTTFAAWSNAAIATYDIPLTDTGGDLYAADWPSGVSAGAYITLFYLQAGASPAITDILLSRKWQTWNGDVLADASTITLSSYALCTLAEAKRFLHLSVTTYDDILTEIINATTATMERIAGRQFADRDYVEWGPIAGHRYKTRHYPLVSVYALRSGQTPVADVTYAGSGIRASVESNATGVVLKEWDSSGSCTTNTFLYASYPSVSLIVAGIDALASWGATTTSDMPSAALCTIGGSPAKNAYGTYTVTLYGPAYDVSYSQTDSRTGVLCTSQESGWACCEYKAGYETVPDDLNMICRELVAEAFNASRRDTSVSSMSLGDYAYTLADSVELTSKQESRLKRYAEVPC